MPQTVSQRAALPGAAQQGAEMHASLPASVPTALTSCMMLPHSVSQACSTWGEPTCSRHLSPDLLAGGGGTDVAKLGESGLDSSEKRPKRFFPARWPLCLALMSTRPDSQCRPRTTAIAMGIFSHRSLLVSAHA